MDLAGLGFLQHNDQNGLAVRRRSHTQSFGHNCNRLTAASDLRSASLPASQLEAGSKVDLPFWLCTKFVFEYGLALFTFDQGLQSSPDAARLRGGASASHVSAVPKMAFSPPICPRCLAAASRRPSRPTHG